MATLIGVAQSYPLLYCSRRLISVSLAGYISFARPDILKYEENSQISLNPPQTYFKGISVFLSSSWINVSPLQYTDPNIPDNGELMYASFPISLQTDKYDCWYAKQYK